MKPVQILGLLICGYLVYQTIQARRASLYGHTKYLALLTIWVSMGAVFAYPKITQELPWLLVFTVFGAVSYLFYLMWRIESFVRR